MTPTRPGLRSRAAYPEGHQPTSDSKCAARIAGGPWRFPFEFTFRDGRSPELPQQTKPNEASTLNFFFTNDFDSFQIKEPSFSGLSPLTRGREW
jgi:hypothetical protein